LTVPVTWIYLTERLFNLMVEYATTDTLSPTFAALSDPTRRAILERLAAGEASVTELAEPFDISLPAVSKQRAGLIERGRRAQWRPCRLDAKPLRQASEWLGEYRRFWEESFLRLDQYLEDLQNAPDAKRQVPKREKGNLRD
jgi:DNA-binding transcriptional ArsR family regulator